MGRTFAGILGPLAFLTITARGLLCGESADTLLWAAWLGLWIFAAIGGIAGWIASRTVEESVRARVAAELAAQEKSAAETAR